MLTEQEVKVILEKHLMELDVDVHLEDQEAKLLDIVGDGLDLVDLVMRLEKELSIDIPDSSMEELGQLNLEQAAVQIHKIYSENR